MVKVSSKNSNFWYPLWILSQLGSTILVQRFLDFSKNSVLSKIGWKTKILRFRNDFWVLLISSSGVQLNFTKWKNPWQFFYRSISRSRGDRRKFEPGAWKTQNFKVLCFEPNFKGRLVINSIGTPWPNYIKIHITNLFIHDSSEEHVFPQILSSNHTGSSKFSSMVSKFRELDSSLF